MNDWREEEGGEAAAVPKPNVDGEVRWIRKAGQLRFGYKRHTVTNPNGMILAEETTAANASDTQHFKGALRRAARGKGLSAREQQLNAGISRARCRIGRTFGAMCRWFRGGTARYVGLAKTHAQHVMEAIAHNLYRAPRLIVVNA